jgi:hypothetical protein
VWNVVFADRGVEEIALGYSGRVLIVVLCIRAGMLTRFE